MSLNSEQTVKLRSLVKAKLVELGEYVDDQLTDYVVIMVTNKKSEKQIAEDLELFLGGIDNATNFSSWLQQIIRNLIAESTSQVNSTTNAYKKQNSRSRQTGQTTEGDEIAIQIDSNEFNDDNHHQHQGMIQQQQTTTNQDLNNYHPTSGRVSTRSGSKMAAKFVSSNATPLITKPINSCIGAVIKRKDEKSPPSASATAPSTSPPPSSSSSSRRRRRSSTSSEDESGRQDRTRRSTGSLPKSSKSMLMKAVDDANRSVNHHRDDEQQPHRQSSHSRTRSVADEKLDEIRSRRKIDATNIDSSLSKRLSFPEESRGVKRLKTGTNRPLGDKRQVVRKSDQDGEHSNSSGSGNEERNINSRNNNNNNDENRPIDHHHHNRRDDDEYYHGHHRGRREVKSPPPPPSSSQQDASQSQSQSQETKFIVTLTGVDEAQFAKSAAAKQRRGGLFEIDAQDEELIYEGDAGYDDFDMLTANDNQADQQLANEHFSQEGVEMMDAEYAPGMMDAQDMSARQAALSSLHLNKKKLTRCSFWPNCEKGDACPYLHPNKPCTAFPNCQFGQKCHYVHPNCRYDGFCTRVDCPYTHSVKKSAAVSFESMQIQQQQQQPQTVITTTTTTTSGDESSIKPTEAATSVKSSVPAPKITINKIQQPYYSLVNTPNQVKVTTNPVVSTTSMTNTTTTTTTTTPGQQDLPTTAPRLFSNKPAFHVAAPNQFTLINRTNTAPTIPINCKFGSLCKNPKCMYTHSSLPQKSQLKWVAPSTTTWVKNAATTELSSASQSSQSAETQQQQQQQQQSQQQEMTSLVNNTTLITTTTTNENIQ